MNYRENRSSLSRQSLGNALSRASRQVPLRTLDREIFYTLKEAQIIIEQWRKEYNTVRPHSALGYRPPAPAAVLLPEQAAPLFAPVDVTTTY